MERRVFLQGGLAVTMGIPWLAALRPSSLDAAADVLAKATADGSVAAAVLHVSRRGTSFTRSFGLAKAEQSMFLLGSISKPICVTALMTLFDRAEFQLDDPLKKFIPRFTGDGREQVTMRHLLTHVSGLPDQLAENDSLRKNHSPLSEFVEHAVRAPLQFAPGERYGYSSMGILLAARVAESISGLDIHTLVDRVVLQPLEMRHSAQGLGRFALADMIAVQTEHAAPEAGGGDPKAKDWDWNSPYWRNLGAPWGGTHASAPDVARFLAEFLEEKGTVVKPATARLMATNQNSSGVTPRGLGLNVGSAAGGKGSSDQTFGHSGSTGTLAWADPKSQTILVVLTSLPGQAARPHPRDLVSDRVASDAT